MIKSFFFITLTLMLLTSVTSAQKKKTNSISIQWKLIAELPPKNNETKSLGFAGAINGVNNDCLIIAGGANFPNGMPWNGGKKFYSNEVFVLQKTGNTFFWNKIKDTLPEAIAYCGVTSTDVGIVYVGGENKNGISNKTFILNWNITKNKIHVKPLPDLPFALTNLAVTHIGNTIYAAGGDEAKKSTDNFFSLNLNEPILQWQQLPHLPIALANATAITQKKNSKEKIYIIGGRTKTASRISELHNTVFSFDPIKKIWNKCADISNGRNTTNLSAAPGVAIDKNYILIIGGDNGKIFHLIEKYISQIAKATSAEEKEKLTKEKNDLSIHHKGFDKSLLLYNTNGDAWTKIGEYPFPAQVTTTAVKWGNDIVISNGEIQPGIRTPDVVIGKEINHEVSKKKK